MNNLQADGWRLDDIKYVKLTSNQFDSWHLERGDIVFNRTNSKELVGKCEVFDEQGDFRHRNGPQIGFIFSRDRLCSDL